MEPGWVTLKNYLNESDDNQLLLHWAVQEAGLLVTSFVGSSPVPGEILDKAIIETAASIFHRRQNQNGIAGFRNDGSPIFFAKDPMNAVYPMLRRWVLPF